MGKLSDEELIALSNQPEHAPAARQAALDELFSRYRTRVALWCFRVVREQDWAADLAQEVFLRALRALPAFRGESRFSTWLYTIARNHCFNAAQSRGIRSEEPLDFIDAPDSAPLVDRELEASQQIAYMRDLLRENLDDTERQVMTLHYAEDLTLDSITRLLGLSNASGAKAYIVSAKRKLKSAVEAWKTGGKR